MVRDFTPGDVAATPHGRALLTESDQWLTVQAEPYAGSVKPLAVLDPASSDPHRLRTLLFAALRDQNPGDWTFDEALYDKALRAALAEFASPSRPLPPEPTGLGAVVVDSDGRQWVRGPCEPGVANAACWHHGAARRRWTDFDPAVTELAPGYDPTVVPA